MRGQGLQDDDVLYGDLLSRPEGETTFIRATLPEPRNAVEAIFYALDEQTFHGYREFEQAVIDGFNQRLEQIPIPGYSYREAITWAERQDWIKINGPDITVNIG